MDFEQLIKHKLKDFKVTVNQYGITISSIESDPNGISIGWIKDSSVFSLRNKIVALKRFDEIEEFLQPISDKHQIGNGGFIQSLNGNTFVGTLQREYPSDLFFSEKLINSDSKESTISFLDKVVDTFVYLESDFFSKHSNLREWKETYNKIAFNELVPIVNQPFPLRNSIMKYLFDSQDREEYNSRVSKKLLESKDEFKVRLGKALLDISNEQNKQIT